MQYQMIEERGNFIAATSWPEGTPKATVVAAANTLRKAHPASTVTVKPYRPSNINSDDMIPLYTQYCRQFRAALGA